MNRRTDRRRYMCVLFACSYAKTYLMSWEMFASKLLLNIGIPSAKSVISKN